MKMRKISSNNKLNKVELKIKKKYLKLNSSQSSKNLGTHVKKYKIGQCRKVRITNASKCLSCATTSENAKPLKKFVNCPGCPKLFRSAYLLSQHQNKYQHWGEILKTRTQLCHCPICHKKFIYVGSRNKHMQNHLQDHRSEVDSFISETTSSFCKKPFLSKYQKLAHIKKKHSDIKITKIEPKTTKCKVRYSRKSNVKNTSKPQNNGIKKQVTRKVFKQSSKQKIKMKLRKNNTRISKCLLSSRASKFKKHISFHLPSKPYNCRWCHSSFKTSLYLIRHQQHIHEHLLHFQCSNCKLKFPSHFQTYQHVVKQHKMSKDSVIALKRVNQNISHPKQNSICVAATTTSDTAQISPVSYKETIGNVQDPKLGYSKYSCDICQVKKFASGSSFYRHKRSKLHQRNKAKFSVPVYKSYSSSDQVELVCSVCKLPFADVILFVLHRLGHFNVQNNILGSAALNDSCYECEICCNKISGIRKIQSHLLWHLYAVKHANKLDNLNSINIVHNTRKDKDSSLCSTSENNRKQAAEKSKKPEFDKNQFSELHLQKNSNLGLQFICRNCEASFATKKGLILHIHRFCKKRPELFQNDLCGIASTNNSCINSTVRDTNLCVKNNPKEQACQREAEGFDLYSKNYQRNQINTQQFAYENNAKLRRHSCPIINIPSQNKFASSCVETNIDSLKYSINGNAFSRPFNNCICNLKELSADLYCKYNHRAYISERNQQSLMCVKCKRYFCSLNKYEEHITIHRPFTCSLCGQVKKTLQQFKDHSCFSVHRSFCQFLKKRKWCVPNELSPEYSNFISNFENKYNESACGSSLSADVYSGLETKYLLNIHHSGEHSPSNSIDLLRNNFANLLYLLIGDSYLMDRFGWGQKSIDCVLENVLCCIGLQPFIGDSKITDIDRLRHNIKLLLQVCIRDNVLQMMSDCNTVDDVVIKMLKCLENSKYEVKIDKS